MEIKDLSSDRLFDLSHTEAAVLFLKKTYPWEVLPEIGEFIKQLGASLSPEQYTEIKPGVWVHKTAKIAETAFFGENIIIGAGTEVRHCAFLRGNLLAGKDCVIGNSTEIKNAILFDRVQIPHYNYVGDSVLGYKAHLGASALTSNVRSDKALVKVHASDKDIETGLKKFGAMVGDEVEVGCGSVLNPGTVIGKRTNIYPLSSVRGCVPEDSIWKSRDEVVFKI